MNEIIKLSKTTLSTTVAEVIYCVGVGTWNC